MTIPADNKADIVQTGISFMRSITEAYGPEKGMELWDTIVATLDPDVKGAIFFAMLTGEYNDSVIITGYNPGSDRVRMIKTIRSVDRRGLGLKEAKDMSDHLAVGKQIKLEIDPTNRSICLSELRRAGFYV